MDAYQRYVALQMSILSCQHYSKAADVRAEGQACNSAVGEAAKRFSRAE